MLKNGQMCKWHFFCVRSKVRFYPKNFNTKKMGVKIRNKLFWRRKSLDNHYHPRQCNDKVIKAMNCQTLARCGMLVRQVLPHIFL